MIQLIYKDRKQPLDNNIQYRSYHNQLISMCIQMTNIDSKCWVILGVYMTRENNADIFIITRSNKAVLKISLNV